MLFVGSYVFYGFSWFISVRMLLCIQMCACSRLPLALAIIAHYIFPALLCVTVFNKYTNMRLNFVALLYVGGLPLQEV